MSRSASRVLCRPFTTAFGIPALPLTEGWQRSAKPSQISYPAPTPFRPEDASQMHAAMSAAWDDFFRSVGDELGVVVLEPQWGSSCTASVWRRTADPNVAAGNGEAAVCVWPQQQHVSGFRAPVCAWP